LLAAEDLADSVSRSYYAVFQAARALLAIDAEVFVATIAALVEAPKS
jgi:uncharacterized protein (UPF0332 family)